MRGRKLDKLGLRGQDTSELFFQDCRVPVTNLLGEEGFFGGNAPEQYGGAGGDFLFDAIVMEELAYLRAHALMASLGGPS